jgi:glutamate racemase
MSRQTRTPRILFVDSGAGGLTVLRETAKAVRDAEVLFIADDAGFPYGDKAGPELVARLIAVIEAAAAGFAPACAVLACNTASTIAIEALRMRFSFPFVGTVPAIKPAATLTKTGLVSVLATPATATREYTHALIARFGNGARFTLVSAPLLASLAEAHAGGAAVSSAAIAREISPCFVEESGTRTDVVVLGCTHYPLLLEHLNALAPWPVTWLDPAGAIARRIATVLAAAGCAEAREGRFVGEFQFTSGRIPSSHFLRLLQDVGLRPIALGRRLGSPMSFA